MPKNNKFDVFAMSGIIFGIVTVIRSVEGLWDESERVYTTGVYLGTATIVTFTIMFTRSWMKR